MLMRIAIYAALGFALLLLNFWFIRGLTHNFLREDFLIAPFQLIGKADADAGRGQALAHLLVARLGEIEREMSSVAEALTGEPATPSPEGIQPQDRRSDYTLSLPSKLFKPLNLEVKVGGVELKGVLAWLQKILIQHRVLQLSVQEGEKATRIGGSWNFGAEAPLWIEVPKDEDGEDVSDSEIVDAVAYQLAFDGFKKNTAEAGALERSEFRSLMNELSDLAEFNRRVALGRPPEDRFKQHLEKIEPLARKAKNWDDLVRLAAQLAEKAAELERALALYGLEVERLRAAGESVSDELSEKLEKLSADLAAELETRRLDARADRTRAQLTEAPTGGSVDKIRQLTGVRSLTMSRQPIVALPGVAPAEGVFPADQVRVLGGGAPAPAEGDQMMTEYVTSVISAVRLVAPDAKFLVIPIRDAAQSSGAFSLGALSEAILALLEEDFDILLMPYGPLQPETFAPLVEDVLDAGRVVVLTAGNNKGAPIPMLQSPAAVRDRLLISAAVDLNATEATFTQYGPGCVWAPGVDIPVRLGDKRTANRSGTTYSAAITAGLAARVLAERPGLGVAALTDLLRESAKGPPGRRPVLNLSEALSRVGS